MVTFSLKGSQCPLDANLLLSVFAFSSKLKQKIIVTCDKFSYCPSKNDPVLLLGH